MCTVLMSRYDRTLSDAWKSYQVTCTVHVSRYDMTLSDACKSYQVMCTVHVSRYDRTLSDACTSLADKWNESDTLNLSRFKPSDLDQFTAYQTKAFLALLLQHVCSAAAA